MKAFTCNISFFFFSGKEYAEALCIEPLAKVIYAAQKRNLIVGLALMGQQTDSVTAFDS